jgi:hypothetical protein
VHERVVIGGGKASAKLRQCQAANTAISDVVPIDRHAGSPSVECESV